MTNFNYKKRIRDQINRKRSFEEKQEQKKHKRFNDPYEEKKEALENQKSRLEKLIPEFYVNQKTISDVSVEEVSLEKNGLDTSSDLSELKEEEKDLLFDRLLTKQKFLAQNNEKSFLYDNTEKNVYFPMIPYSKNNIENNRSRSISNVNISQILTERRFDEYEVKNAAASKFFRVQNKSESLVDNDPTILNIKKLKSKFDILTNEKNNKKDKVLGIDLFKYDKNKWQKKNLREVKN